MSYRENAHPEQALRRELSDALAEIFAKDVELREQNATIRELQGEIERQKVISYREKQDFARRIEYEEMYVSRYRMALALMGIVISGLVGPWVVEILKASL